MTQPTKPSAHAVESGQAVYSARVLRLYDTLVLGFSNRLLWKCPAKHLVAHYNANISANHLDVGVGTGYFLDRCRMPTPDVRIVLMDLNENCLQRTAKRIKRYAPETLQANVLQPLPRTLAPFDSVGLNYLLHCLPGRLQEKAVLFDHLMAVMKPGATCFGSTILGGGVPRSRAARGLMRIYNRKGIFSNAHDDLQSLDDALRVRFSDVSIEVIGCVALFRARGPLDATP